MCKWTWKIKRCINFQFWGKQITLSEFEIKYFNLKLRRRWRWGHILNSLWLFSSLVFVRVSSFNAVTISNLWEYFVEPVFQKKYSKLGHLSISRLRIQLNYFIKMCKQSFKDRLLEFILQYGSYMDCVNYSIFHFLLLFFKTAFYSRCIVRPTE